MFPPQCLLPVLETARRQTHSPMFPIRGHSRWRIARRTVVEFDTQPDTALFWSTRVKGKDGRHHVL